MSKKYLLAMLTLIFAVSSIHSQTTTTPEPVHLPRIAFVSQRANYDEEELFSMDADGTNVTQLTHLHFENSVSGIACSPVDRRILVSKGEAMFLFDITTDTFNRITGDATDPGWSPDGTEMVYASGQSGNYDIFRTTINNPDPVNLTQRVNGDRFPDWSPDGVKILFSSTREDQHGIFTMNPDGTDQVRLTSSAHLQDLGRWSPDGNQIAFVGSNGEEANIYVMNADGTGITRLTGPGTSDWEPQWSPDGSQILFSSYRDDHQDSEIYIMNANGSNPTRLTNEFGEDFSPCWLIEDAAVPSEKTPVPTGTAASG